MIQMSTGKKNLPGISRIALGLHTVLVVTPVIAPAQNLHTFVNRSAREFQTACLGMQ